MHLQLRWGCLSAVKSDKCPDMDEFWREGLQDFLVDWTWGSDSGEENQGCPQALEPE